MNKIIANLHKNRSRRTSSSSSEEEPKLSDGSETDGPIQRDMCAKCSLPFDDNPVNWIWCIRCPRMMHRSCVTYVDLSQMAEEDLAAFEFECDFC